MLRDEPKVAKPAVCCALSRYKYNYFQKAEIARDDSTSAISAFFKNSQVQKLFQIEQEKQYDYLLIIKT